MKPSRGILGFVATCLFAPLVLAQATAEPKFPWEGEVTGTNVNVRSGVGTMFYPTTRLHTGDRVLVLGENNGWYQIAPPPKSFCYVEEAAVARTTKEDRFGTIVPAKIFVRAGSHLVERKTSKQFPLEKGAKVEIIGEAAGFLKIMPPHGASLYMSSQYIRKVPARMTTGLLERYADAGQGLPAVAARSPKTPVRRVSAPTRRVTAPPPPAIKEEPKPTPVEQPIEMSPSTAAIQPATKPETPRVIEQPSPKMDMPIPAPSIDASQGRFQALLTVLESDLQAMMVLPIDQRDFHPLKARYQEIAQQSEEQVPADYARIRLEQINQLMAIKRVRTRFGADGDQLASYRADLTEKRMMIRRARTTEEVPNFDLQGELRKSFAFAPEKRRYRLVDPKRQTTLAYVDVPIEVQENVEHMIGRIVGIRTAGQRYHKAARIPIAVAASLTDLTGGPVPNDAGISNGQNNPPRINNTPVEVRPVVTNTPPPPPEDTEVIIMTDTEAAPKR